MRALVPNDFLTLHHKDYCHVICPLPEEESGSRRKQPFRMPSLLLGSHPDSYLTDVVMPHPVTPLGFQNVNNELKASLIENFLTPSQLLQTVIDHLGVE